MADVKGVIAEDAADGSIDALVNFQAVGWWAGNEQMVLSASTLIVYLKVLQYLAGVPHISNLLHTLARAKGSLFYFTLILLVLVLAFAAAFHLALGNDLYEWRGVAGSIVSLLRFVARSTCVPSCASPTRGRCSTSSSSSSSSSLRSHLPRHRPNAYAERANATYVNLPKVLKEAIIVSGSGISSGERACTIRWARPGVLTVRGALSGRGRAAGGGRRRRRRRRRRAHRQRRQARMHGGVGAQRGVGMDSRTGSAQLQAIQAMSEEDRAAAALKHLDKAKEAMEGGHLFVLNEVATQLKSMCFREDSHKEIPFRSELQRALVELERLSTRNEALKAKALREGWQWDLASATALDGNRQGGWRRGAPRTSRRTSRVAEDGRRGGAESRGREDGGDQPRPQPRQGRRRRSERGLLRQRRSDAA